MKKVKYTQPRVTTHGAIAAGSTGLVSDSEAQKLAQRGECEILEDLPDPKPAKPAEQPAENEPPKQAKQPKPAKPAE